MKLNPKQKIVLAGVLRNQRTLAGLDYHAADHSPSIQRGRHRLAIVRAREGAVPIDLNDWLDRRPTNSDRVMYCRELDRLEIMGLLHRVNFYADRRAMRRASHVKLTAAGREVAERLLAGEAAAECRPPTGQGDDAREETADLPKPVDLDGIDWSSITALIEMPENRPA
jgi:hypothetical protein